ncbi:arginase [Paenimyroides tangerinum]|uniref:Arginase n=1 Tax=Paenimyroides tangerinum TaxID=2488728 RepID=A0A3P3WHB6_9FLAO|nr:formimidoylglutamase [Paenimyroides tangerinum]RRJ93129.1 arginase [Paenimyroides tangerinum]
MIYDFLKPVSNDIIEFVNALPNHSIGRNTVFHTEDFFPELEGFSFALITVNEIRGNNQPKIDLDFSYIRQQFYSLFPGNWNSKLVDLGQIEAGNSVEDTYFLLKNVVTDLLKNKVIPLVLGGSQDLTYAIYRGYDVLEQMVNFVSIDSKIDVVSDMVNPSESFISRIIMEEPNNLYNFSNIGYQTYYNSQEEIDLIDKMYFEAYRLGEVVNNLQITEPILRDADVVSLDLNSIKSADSGSFSKYNPNGFDGREICALARYSGISDRVSSFGIFNIDNDFKESLLIAQILWYFCEGFNYRMNEYPYISKISYFKYIVPLEEQELIFYKSDRSDRWWIETEVFGDDLSAERKVLFPCSYSDYELALSNIIPERWWRAIKKQLV